MEDKFYSRFLLDEHPITFHSSLAVAIGLNEAIILQKINLWLNCKPKNADGRSWIYNSYKSWQEQLPFFSEKTIIRAINNLVDKGILIKGNFNKIKMDRTIWYSIDYDRLDELVQKEVNAFGQNDQNDLDKMTSPFGQNDQMTFGQNDLTNTNEYTMYTNNDYNNDVAEIKNCYEENIGLITPASAEILFDYLKDMSKDLITKAIKIASINNKRSCKYVQGILNDWSKKGFKTLLDVETEQQNFKTRGKKRESNFEQREYDDLSYLYANKGE